MTATSNTFLVHLESFARIYNLEVFSVFEIFLEIKCVSVKCLKVQNVT
jgi:hypothetical protein